MGISVPSTETGPRAQNILLVEDNSTQSLLVRTVLQATSGDGAVFTLRHVETLADAVAAVQETTFDAILLDLTLPDSDGVETVGRVREHCVGTPILVLTSTDDEAVGLEAMDSGAQDYLIKDETYPKLLKRAITYAIHRTQSENALRQARSAAENASRAKSDFLASMSHEFRTPLNAVLGFCQLLSGTRLDENQKEHTKIIENAGEHLLNLINDTLDFAKIEAGQVDIEAFPVNISVLAKECVALLGPLAAKREILLDNAIAGSLNPVLGDRTRIKQVILNLLGNAIKYNLFGGSVSLNAQQSQDWLKVSVSDTGPGIPSDMRDAIFKPFQRVEGGDNVEGAGIGLAVARQLSERMGGTLVLEDARDGGATFTLTLPLAPEHATQASASSPPSHLNSGGYTLLYIEDNAANRSLIERVVKTVANTTFIAAETAERGLEIARAQRPDVIIMDINLPGMNGTEALKAIQADESLQAIPVIALTANALPQAVEAGMRAGFARYLTKPVNLNTFLETVDQTLTTAQWTPTR